MTDSKEKHEQPGEAPTAPQPREYEAPRLEPIGNLRDLVGKSGPRVDNPGKNPCRP